MERVVLLTATERALLHLLPLWNAKDAMREATQEGIAEGTGLLRSHVPRALKPLVVEGHVEIREGRLRGRGRKVRLYVLTAAGIRRAREIFVGVEGEAVQFGDRRLTVRELAGELRISPAEVVAGLNADGTYRPREVRLAVPQAELLDREADLKALAQWLQGPTPIMVVYGSRGMGKTALARAIAGSARSSAVWIDVAPDDTPSISSQLSESLLRLGGTGSPDAIDADLAAVKPLIIVDGYGEVLEPVVDAMASLVDRVTAAPGARLLVLAQESTPAWCRFYNVGVVRKGTVLELRLKGLSLEGTKRFLASPRISEESLKQVYLLTKGCPLYLTLIREGDAGKLREVSRFTAAEVRLLMFSKGSTR